MEFNYYKLLALFTGYDDQKLSKFFNIKGLI